MFSAIRIVRMAAPIALASVAAIAATSPSVAQTPARPSRPAAQPAPAQQQNAQGQANPNAPTIVQVKAEPTQAEWTKSCGKDPGNNAEICLTTRDFVTEQGQPALSTAVYDVKGPQNQAQKVVRFVLPPGLMLKPGIRFAIDQSAPIAGAYTICFPNGCFAETVGLKDETINAMKKGTSISVSVQNHVGRELTFQAPLAGFVKAFDGPAIDPKVLEERQKVVLEQQKRLQDDLEKRSEEMRKRLEQSSSTSGGAAPAPSATGSVPAPARP